MFAEGDADVGSDSGLIGEPIFPEFNVGDVMTIVTQKNETHFEAECKDEGGIDLYARDVTDGILIRCSNLDKMMKIKKELMTDV